MRIKDLKRGVGVVEKLAEGFYLESVVEDDPVLKNGFWEVRTRTLSNHYIFYKQDDDSTKIYDSENKSVELIYRKDY